MVKKTYLAAVTALSIAGSQLSALPIGNPLDATWLCTGVFCEGDCDLDPCAPGQSWCDAWSLRIGYYGDFVFNRKLRVDQHDRRKEIRRTRIMTNAGYLAFNMWNRFDLFGTLGATGLKIDTPEKAFLVRLSGVDTGYSEFVVDVETDLSWSIGVRGTIWECGSFGLGAEAQYFACDSGVNFIENVFDPTPTYLEDADTRYQEWQFGVGATYSIPICECTTFVVPYIGIKWARARFKMGDFSTRDDIGNIFQLFNLKNDHDFGYAVGITLVGNQRWSFTAEARFRDELAAHLNSQFRF